METKKPIHQVQNYYTGYQTKVTCKAGEHHRFSDNHINNGGWGGTPALFGFNFSGSSFTTINMMLLTPDYTGYDATDTYKPDEKH
ncbi:MAG: hypothetical protein R2769_04980 [Saprospiraceae bacterium]